MMVSSAKRRNISRIAGINGARIAIVASQFNDDISKLLLSSCLLELKVQGIKQSQITTVWVPGSFELPVAALKLAQKKSIDAVICLGSVIRGQTYHFEVVANECSRGIMHVALQTGKPVIMGVLTTNTVDQALKRASPRGENKGRDSARSALAMVALLKQIR